MSDDAKAVRFENAAAFGAPLLRALGVDPATVTGFTIRCTGGEIPSMELHRIFREGDADRVQLVVQQFDLRLRSEVAASPAARPEVVFPLNSVCGVSVGRDDPVVESQA